MTKQADFQNDVDTEPPHYDAGVGEVRFVVNRPAAAGWRIQGVTDPEHDILAFAVRGRARYESGGRAFDVDAGSLLYFPAGTVRSGIADSEDPWSFYATAFRLLPADRASASAFGRLPRRSRPADASEVVALFDALDHAWSAREAGFRLQCRGLVLHLLQVLVRTANRPKTSIAHARRLERVTQLLQRNYTTPYRVEELAEIAGLSESRFRVLFKRFTGFSAVQYQNRIRINRARGLLLSGEHTVTRVAELTGFRDVYYFSRLFKQITGISPSSLR